MDDTLIDPKELEFQLYELLDTESLCDRRRFSEHSRDTFDAMIATAARIASEKFAPHNRAADQQEPTFDGQNITVAPDVKYALDAYYEAGFGAGRFGFEVGGAQLPETIMTACAGHFVAANPSTAAYPFLTAAAANLINTFACDTLKEQFVPAMLSGKYSGTMALTEPHAGSSLADIATRATQQADGSYRVKGSKLYISAGDHPLSDNIVHLVLARIEGGPPGVKGISLFVVPKYRLTGDRRSTDNDVSLAGLIHKLGYRGTTSTALSFGDNDDCHGYLLGEPHQGLRYMFMMMNEARLGVGFGAAMIGYRGYQYSLNYAKERHQGRLPPHTAATDPSVAIIQHGDVKRMLLAQKSYVEGAMALCFYGARLIDDSQTLASDDDRQQAGELLDLLTPVIKAWPSEYGVKANDLAIQVLGGAGYTREYPVEQCWRDNRLNPIHEGTNGIQALDLMSRRLWQNEARGLTWLYQRMEQDFACTRDSRTREFVSKVMPYLHALKGLLPVLRDGLRGFDVHIQLANAQCLFNAFATLVIAWMWIRQAKLAEVALEKRPNAHEEAFYQGKLQAAQYFINWELPLIQRDLSLLNEADTSCAAMQPEWF